MRRASALVRRVVAGDLAFPAMAVVWVFLAGARWATGATLVEVGVRLNLACLCWLLYRSEKRERSEFERGVAVGQRSVMLARSMGAKLRGDGR